MTMMPVMPPRSSYQRLLTGLNTLSWRVYNAARRLLGPHRGRRNNAGEQSAPSALEWTLGLGQQSRRGPPGGGGLEGVGQGRECPHTAEGSFVIQLGRSLHGQKRVHIWKHTHRLCIFFFVCTSDRSSFPLDIHTPSQYQYARVVFNLRPVQEKLAMLCLWGGAAITSVA